MLVDINVLVTSKLTAMLSKLTAGGEEDGGDDPVRLESGVFEISHFSFNMLIEHLVNQVKDSNPDSLKNIDFEYPSGLPIGPYGVCDNYKQVIEKGGLNTSDRLFVLSVTPIVKSQQSSDGGWRWHKWGEYIGTQDPQCEYLYDEPEIEKVYTYHIYELTQDMVNNDKEMRRHLAFLVNTGTADRFYSVKDATHNNTETQMVLLNH